MSAKKCSIRRYCSQEQSINGSRVETEMNLKLLPPIVPTKYLNRDINKLDTKLRPKYYKEATQDSHQGDLAKYTTIWNTIIFVN